MDLNKTILLSILLAFNLSACASGPDPGALAGATAASEPDAKTEQELTALRREFLEATRQGDRAALERILAEGFTFVHSTGVVEARKQYIDRVVVSARNSPGPDLEFLEEQIRVYEGRTAVWITRSIRPSRGESPEMRFRGTDVIVKIGDRWQWASVHSTQLPTRPKAAAVAPDLFKTYVGQCEITVGRSLTITEEGESLRGQVTGQRQAELIPKSETELIWFDPDSNVDAQILFVRDESGRVRHAIFRREGAEVWRARKID